MTGLDGTTALVMACLVVAVVSIGYLVTSLRARDNGGARLWALSSALALAAVVFAYVCEVGDPTAWEYAWALALCHVAAAGGVGVLLLGCRAFNGRGVEGPTFLVIGIVVMIGVVTFLDAVNGTPGAGDLWLFLSVGGLSAGIAYHAVTRRLRTYAASWFLLIGCVIGGGYALAVSVSIVVGAPVWYSSVSSAMAVAVVVVLWAVAAFVLRVQLIAGDAARRREDTGVLSQSAFRHALRAVLHRSMERLDLIAVIAVSIDDVSAVTAAFGRASAERSTSALRRGVRRFAAPTALVGASYQDTTVFVATLSSTSADARRQAGLLYRGIVRDFVEARDIAMPGVGIGVALSQTLGYDADLLMAGAVSAAAEAEASEETSVVFARVRDLPVDPFPVESN